MAYIVAQFFYIIGVGISPPTNLAELIPYLLTIVVGLFLVSATLKVVSNIITAIFDLGRM